jgi:CheY-like chemotaxis protein
MSITRDPKRLFSTIIVEDSEEVAAQLKSRLSSVGVNSLTCSTGAQASELLRSTPQSYEAIVVDLGLESKNPGDSFGIDFLEQARKHFGQHPPKLLVLSSYALSADQSRRLEHIGAKVFDKATLGPQQAGRLWDTLGSSSAGERVESLFHKAEIDASITARAKGEDFYSCFISFSSAQESFAARLYSSLQERGVRCWFAPESMDVGAVMRPTIDRAISEHERFVLVLSEKSVASQWVQQEVEKALEVERRLGSTIILPIAVDDAVYHSDAGWACLLKNSRNIGDFRQTGDEAFGKPFNRLLRALVRKSHT